MAESCLHVGREMLKRSRLMSAINPSTNLRDWRREAPYLKRQVDKGMVENRIGYIRSRLLNLTTHFATD